MALGKQVLDVIQHGGLSIDEDEYLVEQPKSLLVENGDFNKRNTIKKRLGEQLLGPNLPDYGAYGSVSRYKDTVFGSTGRGTQIVASDSGAPRLLSSGKRPFTASVDFGYDFPGEVLEYDVARIGDYTCITYLVDTDEELALNKLGVALLDKDGVVQIKNDDLSNLYSGNPFTDYISPQVVAVNGDRFWVIVAAGGAATNSDLVAFQVTISPLTISFLQEGLPSLDAVPMEVWQRRRLALDAVFGDQYDTIVLPGDVSKGAMSPPLKQSAFAQFKVSGFDSEQACLILRVYDAGGTQTVYIDKISQNPSTGVLSNPQRQTLVTNTDLKAVIGLDINTTSNLAAASFGQELSTALPYSGSVFTYILNATTLGVVQSKSEAVAAIPVRGCTTISPDGTRVGVAATGLIDLGSVKSDLQVSVQTFAYNYAVGAGTSSSSSNLAHYHVASNGFFVENRDFGFCAQMLGFYNGLGWDGSNKASIPGVPYVNLRYSHTCFVLPSSGGQLSAQANLMPLQAKLGNPLALGERAHVPKLIVEGSEVICPVQTSRKLAELKPEAGVSVSLDVIKFTRIKLDASDLGKSRNEQVPFSGGALTASFWNERETHFYGLDSPHVIAIRHEGGGNGYTLAADTNFDEIYSGAQVTHGSATATMSIKYQSLGLESRSPTSPTIRFNLEDAVGTDLEMYPALPHTRETTVVETYLSTSSESLQKRVGTTVVGIADLDTLITLSIDPMKSDGSGDARGFDGAILYTDIGELSIVPPPPSLDVEWAKNRLWAIDAERPNVIWYSKNVQPGTMPEFSDALTVLMNDDAVAIGAIDDHVIVFSRFGTTAISGDGPNANGTGQTFIVSTVSNNIGCNNRRSVVSTPEGVVFESDRGLMLLTRAFEFVSIGDAVDKFLDKARIIDSGYSASLQEARFILEPIGAVGPTSALSGLNPISSPSTREYQDGDALSYNVVTNSWTVYTDYESLGITDYNGHLARVSVVGGLLFTHVQSEGYYQTELSANHRDFGMVIETPWLRPDSTQGFRRLYQIALLLRNYNNYKSLGTVFSGVDEGVAGSEFQVELYRNYEPNPYQTTTFSITSALDQASGPDVAQFLVRPGRQKVQCVKIVFRETRPQNYSENGNSYAFRMDQGFELSSLSLEMGVSLDGQTKVYRNIGKNRKK